MEKAVVISKSLEDFLERLLRWDELCAQLRELYYRYLDLAAFRSDKCFFPSRKCKRSWNRQYDIGDLTLMWTYIVNTAPLCGKLMRALAEVEYKIHVKAIESIEKYGTEYRDVNGIVHVKLKRPVHGYLVLLNDRVYLLLGEIVGGLPKSPPIRSAKIEYKVMNIIEQYRGGGRAGRYVDEFEIDDEYRRLWIEVPLPENASKLLGGQSKAPVALFTNLGWLLSDDGRSRPIHTSSNIGQVALRLFDWIALTKYAVNVLKMAPDTPLVFKLSVYEATKSKDGIIKPQIEVRPLVTTKNIIQSIYSLYGITLGKSEEVITNGYAILKALREAGFRREGSTYVVDDVGAWIAFSATVATLVLGDGYVRPTMFGITAKPQYKREELAKAIGGLNSRTAGALSQIWHMRLLLPISPMPIFEKAVRLYNVIVNFPAAVVIEIDGTRYILSRNYGGQFVIGKQKGAKLYEILRSLGISVNANRYEYTISYTELNRLRELGVPVLFLNDVEKEQFRETKPAPSVDLEAVKVAMERVLKIAEVKIGTCEGRMCVKIKPISKPMLEEIVAILKEAKMRFVTARTHGKIYIREPNNVEAIRKVMPHIFSQHRRLDDYTRIISAFPLPFTFLLSKRRRRRCPTKIPVPSRRLPSAWQS